MAPWSPSTCNFWDFLSEASVGSFCQVMNCHETNLCVSLWANKRPAGIDCLDFAIYLKLLSGSGFQKSN